MQHTVLFASYCLMPRDHRCTILPKFHVVSLDGAVVAAHGGEAPPRSPRLKEREDMTPSIVLLLKQRGRMVNEIDISFIW